MIACQLVQGSQEWLKWRSSGGDGNRHRCGIGASDANIIMGCSEFMSVDELWAEKSGVAQHNSSPNWVAEVGHEAEPIIRGLVSMDLGVNFTPGCFEHSHHPWMLWSADGISDDGTQGLECKLVGRSVFAAVQRGDVPEKFLWQIMHALGLGLDVVHLAAGWGEGIPHRLDNLDIAVVPVFPDEERLAHLLRSEREFLACVDEAIRPSSTDWFAKLKVARATTVAVHAPIVEAFVPVTIETELDSAPIGQPAGGIVPVARDAVATIRVLSDDASTITIAKNWIAQRDAWIVKAQGIVSTLDDGTRLLEFPQDAQEAASLINNWAKLRKRVQSEAKRLKDPLNEVKAAIDQAVNSLLVPAATSEADLQVLLTAFRRREQDAIKAAEDAAAQERAAQELVNSAARKAAAEAGAPAPPPARLVSSVLAPIPAVTKIHGAAPTRHLEFRVVGTVPGFLCSPDPKLIREHLTKNIDITTWPTTETEVEGCGVVAWVREGTRATGRS